MKKIILYPAEILRKKTEEIEKVDKKLLAQIDDLKKVLKNGDNAAGLAAPQIGLNKRFFGSKEIGNGNVVVFINPKIEKTYGEKIYLKLITRPDFATGPRGTSKDKKNIPVEQETDFLEGCLSFPGYFGTVKRFFKIDVSWSEIDAAKQNASKLIRKNKTLEGFEAIVWQHESDHLEGIVFIDHIKEEKGKLFKDVDGKMVLQTRIDFT